MGSIYKRKLPGGGISFQVLVRQQKRGQEPVCVSGAFETEQEAKRFVEETEAKLKLGLLSKKTEADRTTFAESVVRYKQEILPTKRGARQDSYRLDSIVRHFHGSAYFLSNITAADISKYRDERLKTHTGTSVLHELALISHIFTVAIKDWGFTKLVNPVMQIRKPKMNRGRDRRLMAGELDYVLAACRSEDMKRIVKLALETAMRQSEIGTLTWEMIDMKEKVLTLDMTKNGTKRVVPLSPSAQSLLSSLPRPLAGGKVFDMNTHSIAVGFRRVLATARKAYEKECAEQKKAPDAKFLVDLHFHDLRHEATSRLFEKGLSVAEVSAITGHLTLQMLKRYTHISPAHLVERLAQ